VPEATIRASAQAAAQAGIRTLFTSELQLECKSWMAARCVGRYVCSGHGAGVSAGFACRPCAAAVPAGPALGKTKQGAKVLSGGCIARARGYTKKRLEMSENSRLA